MIKAEEVTMGDLLAAKRAVVALVESIESTGGLIYDDDRVLVPYADQEWSDIADVYLEACKAIGRKPMIEAEPEAA